MYDSRKQRHVFQEFVKDQKPTMMLTFNFQRRRNFDQIQKAIELFMNKLQRQILGRNWGAHPAAMRPSLIGVAEHLDPDHHDNPHVHAALVASEAFVAFLETPEAEAMWRSSGQWCGQLDAAPTRDTARMVSYIFKEAYDRDWQERMVLYAPKPRNR